MRNHLIAIQGSAASFHDLAAKKYFGEEVSVMECGSFKEVCDKIAGNKVDYGIIAIENKVAGSILLNYQLIESYKLHIIGETYLPIELQLLGKEGSSLAGIKEIISHPMALGQSQDFLSGLENVTVTEFKDTATCAKLVLQNNGNEVAVIAGPAVGKKYDLKILKHDVADVSQNFTRFYILSKGDHYADNANKASITLQVKNIAGKLSDVLSVIKARGLNMTKIQSVPSPGDANIYSFHLDIEFDARETFVSLMKELESHTTSLKVLGIYKGERHTGMLREKLTNTN
ncbi:MAG TPA: prephenate dehydratase domain-containing protein [Bacteroidia bacterium]|jgi:prephenate dehydratase|nr:prephenate dehydratase domain-containing protein [Bacteroidia bacterium]